jgi:hypothetical protein
LIYRKGKKQKSFLEAIRRQNPKENKGVCHTRGLAIKILKSIVRQKKNYIYENSNISPCKNILKNLQNKNPLKETKNPSRYRNSIIITNLLSFNTSQNITFQKSSYKKINRPIIIIIIIT